MPLIPEEPQIHESVPGPRAVPAPGRTAPTPALFLVPARPPARSRPAWPGAGPPRPAPRAAEPTPQIQLIPASVDGALDAADEAVDLLLDTGRAPSEVLVLTTGDAHPWAAHELSFGEASYWAQHDASDDVFYAAADAERARPRPVVVVAVNGGTDAAVAGALPAAMSRAGALLIVCGDPERVNTLLAASV
ncbi:hypothetical protein [Streptomyces griseocarneus]|uniref:Uncharacterized protein n=1 Tax=Streptomyces griseocarneus TaxID=51201 RepID=A0ABX7RR50_9ACTN|nr:hypothetical protein [Streptomyces griseocarneus]QSY50749.1 hypothetical protein J3S04_07395 [Streptomyces griseocarneus]